MESYEASKHFFGCMMKEGSFNFVMNYNMQNMNKELPELFSMLKAAEIEIQKEHQVLMVNKTTSFKKQGKPKKGNFKKGGKKAAAPPEKPKGGPKPDTECYYCNGKGHWKRNFPKYLADLKRGLVKKKKGISDIHVIDVYLTGSRTSISSYDSSDDEYDQEEEENISLLLSYRAVKKPKFCGSVFGRQIVERKD
nr:uncharacterized protein LOC127315372 [Lolium perenne]